MDQCSSSTRIKRQNNNWYALAAVATALQMTIGFENETKLELKNQNLTLSSATTQLGTQIVTVNDFDSRSLTTLLSDFNNEYLIDDNFTISPQYIAEFKISVNTFKIDKSPNKIFLD